MKFDEKISKKCKFYENCAAIQFCTGAKRDLVDLEKCEKNAPTLAIVGTHTAENEPSKVFAEIN